MKLAPLLPLPRCSACSPADPEEINSNKDVAVGQLFPGVLGLGHEHPLLTLLLQAHTHPPLLLRTYSCQVLLVLAHAHP